ncbi:MAG TPA: hypothetical protein VF501_01150 [Thiobacillus sp.]
MKLHVLYFARLRERLGVAEETLDFGGATSQCSMMAEVEYRIAALMPAPA